jgi:class 3 adenylate cyclase
VVVREGDCYGRVVNVAARVMDNAKPRGVLVTPEVVAASKGDRVRFDEVGPVELRGVSAPIWLSLAAPTS